MNTIFPWVVVDSDDDVIARYATQAEANAHVAFRGGLALEACTVTGCPEACACIADISDGKGFRPMCFDHAFGRGLRVGSDSELAVSA